MDIITIGECLIELSTESSLASTQTFDKYFGGDTLCSAVCASRMGSNVGYISKIGQDCFQEFLYKNLLSEGLNLDFTKSAFGSNGVYFVGKNADDKNEVEFYRKKTASSLISVDDINEDYFKSSKCFYATGTVQSLSSSAFEAVTKAYKISKDNSLISAYDPNYSEKLWMSKLEAKDALDEIIDNIDILFLNITKDVQKLYDLTSIDIVIKHFWDKGVSIVVVKSNMDQGFYVGYNGEITFTNYYLKDNVESFGAGDTFNGAFLHAIVNGFNCHEACKFASIVSGLQTQKEGAIKSIPYRDDVYGRYKSGI